MVAALLARPLAAAVRHHNGQLGSQPACPARRRNKSGAVQQIAPHSRRASRPPPAAASSATESEEATAAAAAEVEGFCVEHELPQGRLVIRAVREADVGAASVLLTRAFATSAQGVHIIDGRKFCTECLAHPPRAALLVARLFPADGSLLMPGQESRVVATTSLSFTRDTRETFPSLQPPDDAAYLSNMAVDPALRRQGHARRMLAAAEAMAATRRAPAIWLHARLWDTPALHLYLSAGYAEVERDSVLLAKLRSITPRALMVKPLA